MANTARTSRNDEILQETAAHLIHVNLGAKWGQLTESDWTTFSC